MARILLLTHIYPPAIDGGSKAISKIGDYLNKQGHQLLVITSNRSSTDDFVSSRRGPLDFSQDNTDIIRLPVITFLHRPLKLLSKVFPFFKTFSKGPIFTRFPIKKTINFKPDFIIAGPLPTTIILYAHLINYLTNHLLRYSTKLLILPCFHPNDPDFQTPLLISLLNKSDYLWCLTNYEKKYFQQKLNIKSPKYFVHGLGVDSDFIIKKTDIKYPKNPHIIFIANFSAHKRSELLIQAFDLILKKYPKASLTLLGQKTLYFPQIKAFLKRISPKTRKKINFIFSPGLKQIKNSIDTSSCLVLPSLHESFGLVFVESLARGKAIIGANTAQTSEVIKTLKGGVTFEADNLQSLYRSIDKLLSSQAFTKKLATQGHQTVKNFYTWNRIGKGLCKKLAI
jgi:glycosyltransferase involved in cell wall biosynthesis